VSLRRILAITVKELRHIMRDRATLILVVLMPTMLLIVLAYMVTADIQHVPLAVLDLDQSPTSRAFVQQITLGDDLDLHSRLSSFDEIEALLMQGEVKAALVIPPNFERDLLSMRGMPMQVVIDGTEPQSGGFAVDHIGRRAEEFASNALAEQFRARGLQIQSLQPIDLRVRTWYNPNLKASIALIPGLLTIALGMPGMSVALTLAREREHGTLEQLLATPIGRAELLLGKIFPYVLSGLLNVIITTLVAVFWFQVPLRGSFLLFLLLSAAYYFAILSLGMVIGVLIRTQAAALALSFLIIGFPGFFLTGVFFPIASMPPIVRMEAMSMPGTHFAIITRGLFTVGLGLEDLWLNGVVLLGMGILFIGTASLFFKKKLA
jgi:ABC-2 type transport system permease protein